MDKIRLLKAMTEQERAQALNSVINSSARLYVAVTTPDWLLVPEEDYGEHLYSGGEKQVNINDLLEASTSPNGLLEFFNGAGVATELISVPDEFGNRFMPTFLDDQGRSCVLATFRPAKLEDSEGALVPVSIEITLDLLAVAFAQPSLTKTRIDPVKALMMRYLDETNGVGDFQGCWEYLLKDPEIEEGIEGRLLYSGFNKKLGNASRKSIQNRLSNYRKEWRSNN